MRRRWPYRPYFGGSVATMGGLDADVILWRDAVVTNGGTVSAARLATVSTFVAAEKASGAWALTDDYWGLWAENAVQALTSLKQRRLATAVNSPAFTADRGYVFDGATNYIDTGFVPSTHAVAMTGSDMAIGVYERTNVTSSSGASSAGASSASTVNIRVLARTTTNMQVATNCTLTNVAAAADSSGLSAAYRVPGPTYGAARNGVSVGTYSPAGNTTSLIALSIWIGGFNSSGVLVGARANSVGFVLVGKSDIALSVSTYNNIQAWATAVGAQV